MRALVKYLDGISRRRHRRPEHPDRHPAGLRTRRRPEADPQLLPRRSAAKSRARWLRSLRRARPSASAQARRRAHRCAALRPWSRCVSGAARRAAPGSTKPAPRVPGPARRTAASKRRRAEGAAPRVRRQRQPQRQRELQGEQRELQSAAGQLKRAACGSRGVAHREAADALRRVGSGHLRRQPAAARAGRRRGGRCEQQIAALQERSRAVARAPAAQERPLGRVCCAASTLAQHGPLAAAARRRGSATARPGRSPTSATSAAPAAQSIGELRERRARNSPSWRPNRDAKQVELAAIAADEQRNRAGSCCGSRPRASRRWIELARQLAAAAPVARHARARRHSGSQRCSTNSARCWPSRQRRSRRGAAPQRPARPAPSARPAPRRRRRRRPSTDPPAGCRRIAQLRGKLPLPVRGRDHRPLRQPAAHRRRAWMRLPGRACSSAPPPGADVHAVAAGRVVFADWLRGFGNLLVIDHGDGFLSVYGNNETLLANVGDRVAAGDVGGHRSGNTGGNRGRRPIL
ncbi:MAG: M23 family metallopeptidase [Comamonadaceae bacterium]|nr:M23 family metallopeptidase [Comamonadaceae bacterium]